ncbi:MAG TPA: CCA tRNA nucleotidyltransferase [Candidatus Thermoplasmatota archaeon]|nr:CCA tRNA nucleotidyltransferase [Candidatus Thermoplasmatota archaeon]
MSWEALPLALGLNLGLAALGLALFDPWRRGGRVSIAHRVDRYGVYIAGALTAAAVVAVQWVLDASANRFLGLSPSTFPRFDLPVAPEPLASVLAAFFSLVMVVVHPFMLFFAALLYILSDEERAAKTALLAIPVFVVLALPFFVFLPVRPPAPPVFAILPELGELYYPLASDNTVPNIHVSLALALALAGSKSRNLPFRFTTYAYAGSVVLAVPYLGLSGPVGWGMGMLLGVFVCVLINRILSVERIALSRVAPNPEERRRILQAAQGVVAEAQQAAARAGMAVDVFLAGSAAKDTYLRDHVDIDVFVGFPPQTPREEMQRKGLALAREVLPDGIEKYAEHPYLSGRRGAVGVEIVPCYKVDDPSARMSAVDRTPFHTIYIRERLDADGRAHVRLLKQFLLGIGAYGADARFRGFSGYVCELLVAKYGTFRGVLSAAARWKPGTFLCLEPYEGAGTFPEPLVIVDPVDPNRNAASAVSPESLLLLREAAMAYLAEPRLTFFFPRPPVPLDRSALQRLLEARGSRLVAVAFDAPDVLEDALHAQMRKCGAGLAQLLSRQGFDVRSWSYEIQSRAGPHPGRAEVLLELREIELPTTEVHAGPPVDLAPHAERFQSRWKDDPSAAGEVYEKEGRLHVVRRREFPRAPDLLRMRALALDLGKDVNAAMARRFDVAADEDALALLDPVHLTRHLSGEKPWEQ